MKNVFILSLAGLTAGFLNGLLGTGGALPLLSLFALLGFDADNAFATANLLAMLLSLVSLIIYLKTGALETDFISEFFSSDFLIALVGGALGGIFLSKVSPRLLKGIFCFIIIIGGVGVVFK